MPRYASIYHNSGYGLSKSRPKYLIIPNVVTINQTESVTFDITSVIYNSDKGAYTNLFWTTEGTVPSNQFINGNFGSVHVEFNTGQLRVSIAYNPAAPAITSFRILLRSGSILGPVIGSSKYVTVNRIILSNEAQFTVPGLSTWVVPSGITSISVVCIGGGGGAGSVNNYGGGGGALAYVNDISVTPGETINVNVGAGGLANWPSNVGLINGKPSYIIRASAPIQKYAFGLCSAGGGYSSGLGGSVSVGSGGNSSSSLDGGSSYSGYMSGGGGAGGYSGAGGTGGRQGYSGGLGAGGGGGGGAGGGGALGQWPGGNGGGVGIYGEGNSGAGGVGYYTSTTTYNKWGNSGEAGSNGNGIAFGGGAGGMGLTVIYDKTYFGIGSNGAVRIVWPGTTRQFPSTNVGPIIE